MGNGRRLSRKRILRGKNRANNKSTFAPEKTVRFKVEKQTEIADPSQHMEVKDTDTVNIGLI